MNNKQRLLAVLKGDLPDRLPYAPRIELWFNAMTFQNALPAQYQGMSADEICLKHGWALHKVVPDFKNPRGPEDIRHRGLGLFSLREYGMKVTLPSDVGVVEKTDGDVRRVSYHTPYGSVSFAAVQTEELKASGVSITHLEEHVIKTPDDCKVLAYIFGNTRIDPDYEAYTEFSKQVGDNGIACLTATLAGSPMLHIQRDLLDTTNFFYFYNDHPDALKLVVEGLEPLYEQILDCARNSPAEVVMWGTNFDDMLTYPVYFEKEILPWLQKAASGLHDSGKYMLCHTDGENQKLIGLLSRVGMDVAEALCPFPMTKVHLHTYLKEWGRGGTTIFGGIPQSLLVSMTASDQDLEDYLSYFLEAVAPGKRIIAGIADSVPANADFSRVVKIGDYLLEYGKLPLRTGGVDLYEEPGDPSVSEKEADPIFSSGEFEAAKKAVLGGDGTLLMQEVESLLAKGVDAEQIVQESFIAAMDEIGEKFKDGTVFIPEVLLSARAMNQAIEFLKPHLKTKPHDSRVKIVFGTVRGDLHDIGKNIVIAMLKGAGFNVIDMGINVKAEDFVQACEEHSPDILALSALLTSTMPEMKKVIDQLADSGLRDKVKVIVGGAPVNSRYAREISADGYAPDAGSAVGLIKGLLK